MWKLLTGLGLAAAIAGVAVFTLRPASAQCTTTSRVAPLRAQVIEPVLTNGAPGLEVFRAALAGDTQAVAALIGGDPALLTTRTVLPEGDRPSNGNTADLLTAAVAACDLAMVETLLDLGADPNGLLPGQR